MHLRSLCILSLCLSLFSCSDNIVVNEPSPYNPENPNPPVPSSPPNILLIIADDVGIDPIIGYEEGAIKANTPNIESLINNGLTFMKFLGLPGLFTYQSSYSHREIWIQDRSTSAIR